jgi:dolichol kinase
MDKTMSASTGETVTTDSHLPRKLFHLLAASMIPTIYYFEMIDRQWTLGLTLATTLVWVIADIGRIKNESINLLFKRMFASLMKTKEEKSLTGASYTLIGSSLSLLLFSPAIAVSAIYFMAIGDPTASVMGKAFGKTRFSNGKSIVGSVAMFLICLMIAYAITGSAIMAIIGATVAAITEFLTGSLDDNLTIPLVAGGAMTVGQWLYP